MRVYEFSKQSGVPVKDIIEILQREGFEVKSHMAALDEQAEQFLNKKFAKQASHKEVIAEQPATGVEKKSVARGIERTPVLEQMPEPVAEKKSVTLSPKVQPDTSIKDRSISTTPLKTAYPSAQVSATNGAEGVTAEIPLEAQTVAQFAQRSGVPLNEVILTLLRWGTVVAKNQIMNEALVERLATQYHVQVVRPEPKRAALSETNRAARPSRAGQDAQERPPVVVVLGHVDHGKTTLLDFIRKTRVAAREKGGITQHLGAYVASTPQGDIVFLDTPGHEAFSRMRQRGVHVADIAVLVVAADDGVMPQTVEAIKHAQAMNVPIVIAVNKIDKVGLERVDVIKRQLAQHNVLTEDWGGSAVCIPLSAKTGQGIDQFLEMLVLQAQLMELRAETHGPAEGYVLESRIEKGVGPVATVLLQHGTLSVGDYFSCGTIAGRVNALADSTGKRLQSIQRAVPVRVGGFGELPNAGTFFQVVARDQVRKSGAHEIKRESTLSMSHQTRAAGGINIIIKTDTNSTKEALLGSIENVSKKLEKGFNIIHAAAGDITESDVELAATTGARIVGLHVKTELNALQLAQQKKVSITLYDIIYRLLEALEQEGKSQQQVAVVKTKIGEARVLKVFDIKGVGVVAGSIVTEGKFSRDGFVAVWRAKRKIGEGKITSLQREKKSVKEVHTNFECGFVVEGMHDWLPDDRVECFVYAPAA